MIKKIDFARWSRWALWLLAFSLPYELDSPLLQIGVLSITNVEIVLGLFLLLTALSVVQSGKRPFLPPRYWRWMGLFVIFLLLSTALAPEFQINAIKATLRLFTGGLLALAVMQIVQTRQHVRQIVIALLSGGITAVFIGMIEVVQNAELAWLAPFRTKITVVGHFIRLTGPFDYANQAAMFIEATLPLLLALTWEWAHKRQQGWKYTAVLIALFFTLLFYLEASFLTFSRASFATIIIVAVAVGLLLFLRTKRQRDHLSDGKYWQWWAALAIATLLLTIVNSLVNTGFRFRVQQLAQEEAWYRANIVVTDVLQMESGTTKQIPVSITNEGSLIWHSDGELPIHLGARWLNTDTGLQHGEPRWSFTTAVFPEESITMQIPLTAPQELGTYDLRWDIVQEQVTWFAEKSGIYAETAVTVFQNTQSDEMELSETEPQDQRTAVWVHKIPIPNRQTLWGIAARMIGERPLLGHGLDNYRLLYGRWLNAADWNETIHTNNWYLEMLVSIGLLGSAPFFIWLFSLGVDGAYTIWQRGDVWQTAIAAALFAFIVHGVLDFFLLFTSTGLLFWLLAGLWAAIKNIDDHSVISDPFPAFGKKDRMLTVARNYRQKSDKSILPLLIVAILYAVFLALQLAKNDYDFSAFVTAGDLFVDGSSAPSNLTILQDSAGYDGQFYYRLALTPFTNLQTDWGITIDMPAYRQQRILYPLLARFLSFGQPVLLPVSLIFVNFLSLCILAWLGAKYVQTIRLHAIWGVIFALFPGFLLTLTRDTTEIVEITFLLAAILALRQHRQFLAGLLLVLAVFAKETALIMSFGLLLEHLLIRQRRHFQASWFPAIVPIAGYLLWQTWLKSIWDRASITGATAGSNIGLPLFGVSRFIDNIVPATGHLQQVWLLELFLIVLFMLAVMYLFFQSAAQPFIKLSWLLFAVLTFSLTQAVWVEDWAFLRVFPETYLFGVIILLESKSVLKRWIFGGVIFSWIFLAAEILKMR